MRASNTVLLARGVRVCRGRGLRRRDRDPASVPQRLPRLRVRARGDLLHRPGRAADPHRLHRTDLSRPRRVHGGRWLRQRSADPGQARTGGVAARGSELAPRRRRDAGRLDDPDRCTGRRDRRLPARPPGPQAPGPLPRPRHLRLRRLDAADPARAGDPDRWDERAQPLRDDGGQADRRDRQQRPHPGDRQGPHLQRLDLLPRVDRGADRAGRRLARPPRPPGPRVPRDPGQRGRGGLVRRQPRLLQDARIRDQRRLRGSCRRAPDDRLDHRHSRELPRVPLDPALDRRRRRRARLAPRPDPRRALRLLPPGRDPGARRGRLAARRPAGRRQVSRHAVGHLRRRPDRRHVPAAARCGELPLEAFLAANKAVCSIVSERGCGGHPF